MDYRADELDMLDIVNKRNGERYQNNCYYLGGFRIRAKRSYYKLKEEVEKLKEDDSVLGKSFTLKKAESNRMLAITSAPTVFSLVPAVVGMVGITGSLAFLLLGIGAEVTPEIQKVLDSTLDFMGNSMKLTGDSLSVAFKTSLLPLSVGTISLIKTEIEKHKALKKEQLESDMCSILKMVEFITDLKMDKEDISLNFIKEFLSNVDITRNSPDYNIDMLYYLLNYRIAVVEEKGKQSRRKSTNAFVDFVDFLSDTTTKDGADSSFIHNTYVEDLVKLYSSKVNVEESVRHSK